RVQVDVPVDKHLVNFPNEASLYNELSLLWYQKTNFEWELSARQRGVYNVGPPMIRAGDLFGFYSKARKPEKESLSVVVYPRLVPIRTFDFRRKDFFGVPGAKSPVQDPIYILGTRDYHHWQPARYIHWKASARHNRLQEKVFEPSSQEKILLMVDVMQFEKQNARDDFEKALEVAASLAVQCEQNGYAIGFLTNGKVKGGQAFLPVSRGRQQLLAILETLARLDMKSQSPFVDLFLNGISFHWGISGVCFAYESDMFINTLDNYFLHRHIPTVFLVCRTASASEDDMNAPGGRVRLLDAIRIEENAHE
ncbi:DUF58 domain-containing protein, partial [Thermodesulfobacteriota bacterium]